jgi:hypothetical protein
MTQRFSAANLAHERSDCPIRKICSLTEKALSLVENLRRRHETTARHLLEVQGRTGTVVETVEEDM